MKLRTLANVIQLSSLHNLVFVKVAHWIALRVLTGLESAQFAILHLVFQPVGLVNASPQRF